jgi:hypothetical protein
MRRLIEVLNKGFWWYVMGPITLVFVVGLLGFMAYDYFFRHVWNEVDWAASAVAIFLLLALVWPLLLELRKKPPAS